MCSVLFDWGCGKEEESFFPFCFGLAGVELDVWFENVVLQAQRVEERAGRLRG